MTNDECAFSDFFGKCILFEIEDIYGMGFNTEGICICEDAIDAENNCRCYKPMNIAR